MTQPSGLQRFAPLSTPPLYSWLVQQERKQELPAGPQIFLADISLLFHQAQADVELVVKLRFSVEVK